MLWLKLLQPDLNLKGSILNLTPDILQEYNLKGLVLDVDETLVPFRSTAASAELQAWIEQTKRVAALWLVSNNLSDARIGSIARSLNLPYIFGAVKPSRRKLRQAVTAMNLPLEHIAIVGDRIFTDVVAGNRLGIFTVLVEPMVAPGEALRISFVRNLEVLVSQAAEKSLAANNQKLTKSNKS